MKVGAHQDTGEPLGIPVSKENREWRIKAHDAFDKLWKEGNVTRGQAYRWLTSKMKLGEPAHIANMNIAQCRKVIGLCKLTPPRCLEDYIKERDEGSKGNN
jgi:hypothetical protein